MIEINLLPGPKKKRAAAAGFQMPDFAALLTKVKDPLLIGAAGAWVVVLVAVGLIFTIESRRVAALREEQSRVEAEARRFQALIAQKRREERLRDSLLVQLEAIRGIDRERYVWPHILEEVTKAVPDFTWLQTVSLLSGGGPADVADTLNPPLRILIDGRTSDMGGYTRLLRQLGNSPWLSNVVAGATRTITENEKPIVAFTVTATFRQADAAFVRTVPVLESVR
ncbi:MAG TPA: PilN domain-containing protein [Gemmatimonadales bacterium]|nr:PilN domain-containing protein [Gemmatimonadales bacterium]